MKNLIVLLSLFYFNCLVYAQTCSDGMLNGNELRIDCGGDCPPCIPLMYDGEYTPEGQLEIFLTLPPYLYSVEELNQGIYYEMTTGFNNVCGELPDCQPFLVLGDEDNLLLDVYKKTLDGDILGFGRLIVQSQCLSCQPAQVAANCPDNTPLQKNMSVLEQENGYMVELEMLDGTPPYRVFDNTYELFYEDNIDSSRFYLGAFPDTLNLDLFVYDFWGCRVDVLYNPMTIDTTGMDTTMIDTTMMDTTMMDTTMIDTTTALFGLTLEKGNNLSIQPTLFDQETMIYLPFASEVESVQVTAMNGTTMILEANQDWMLINEQTLQLRTSQLPSGLLYFSVQTNNGRFVGKGLKY